MKEKSKISVISKAVEEPVELEFWGKRNRKNKMIEEMIVKGVDVFQINMSHTKIDVCLDLIKKIRRSEKKLNKIIGIMELYSI